MVGVLGGGTLYWLEDEDGGRLGWGGNWPAESWGWADLAWLRMAPWRGDSELGSANGAAGPVGVAGLTEWDVATGKS